MTSRTTPVDEHPSRPFTSQDIGIYSGVQMIPVPPEHEHAPSPGTVNITKDWSRCYVLDSEWPMVEAALRQHIETHK